MSQPRYSVVALPGGWVVAINTATGRRVAISDHAHRATAQAEADRLNSAWVTAEARRVNLDKQSAISERLARLRLRVADLAAA